ncbi:hypothetical protein VNO78_15907 [Psophocarpus tetragonolobus]|uniref:Uncharacterized protein n=1 Tax=Psophocarpus tetragonolobus TaxID=3891 RepID=A0AAN9XK08_PSOTE
MVFVMKLIWARFCSSLDLVAKLLGFMIAVIHFNFYGCQHHIFICIWFIYGFYFNQKVVILFDNPDVLK